LPTYAGGAGKTVGAEDGGDSADSGGETRRRLIFPIAGQIIIPLSFVEQSRQHGCYYLDSKEVVTHGSSNCQSRLLRSSGKTNGHNQYRAPVRYPRILRGKPRT